MNFIQEPMGEGKELDIEVLWECEAEWDESLRCLEAEWAAREECERDRVRGIKNEKMI